MKQAEQRKRPAAKGTKAARGQTGGTIIGFIAGVVVGLVAALALAVYVTKVPVPFMSGKAQAGRTPDQDAAESKKNQNWDPNTPLHGRNPARPAPAGTAPAPAPAPAEPPLVAVPAPATAPTPAPRVDSAPVARPATPSADPLGDLARARSAAKSAPAPAPAAAPATPTADPFDYFVQAGAFRTADDAETQRARLAMMGLEARVTEREQAGRTVYRVRMGPYRTREDAERTKARLDSTGADAALVRVQR
ncbi:MAG TPA: SPOR domain-containing protein [Pseudorhodoferax sp.]|nr:SPOR domain-containing protein [Pseudorhodoferax sp.]